MKNELALDAYKNLVQKSITLNVKQQKNNHFQIVTLKFIVVSDKGVWYLSAAFCHMQKYRS